MVMTGKCNC